MCNVVYDDGAVCVSVVHWRQRLVALLSRGIPDLELDRCLLVEGDGLGEERGADGGFSVVVELVLDESQHQRRLSDGGLAEQDELELGEAGARAAALRGTGSHDGGSEERRECECVF